MKKNNNVETPCWCLKCISSPIDEDEGVKKGTFTFSLRRRPG